MVVGSGGQLDVVVLGAGVAGRRVQLLLGHDARFRVRLVDAAAFSEFTPSVLRVLVEPSHAHAIVVPHAQHDVLVARAVRVHMQSPPSTRAESADLNTQQAACLSQLTASTESPLSQPLLTADCSSSDSRQVADVGLVVQPHHAGWVELEGGQQLPFDFLVVCIGSAYSQPIKYGLINSTAVGVSSTSTQSGQELSRTGSADAAQPADPGRDRTDFPVMAPSSTAPSTSQRIVQLHAAAAQLAAAGCVLILGGGTVGVELAAEIVGKFGPRGKQVTLVTSTSSLLPRMPPRAGRYAAAWLSRHGVRVVCGERVTHWPQGSRLCAGPGTVVLASGQELTADLVYDCTGLGHGEGSDARWQLLTSCLQPPPVAEPVQELDGPAGSVHGHQSEAAGLVSEVADAGTSPPLAQARDGNMTTGVAETLGPGRDAAAAVLYRGLRTERTLQVAGNPAVFVAGDAAVTGWEATALAAELQGTCVAHNIAHAASDSPLSPYPEGVLPKYAGLLLSLTLHAQPTITSVSLGKYSGVIQVGQVIVCGFLAAFVKVLVEWLQLGVARRSWLLTRLWLLAEGFGVVLCALMQTRWACWLLGPPPGATGKQP